MVGIIGLIKIFLLKINIFFLRKVGTTSFSQLFEDHFIDKYFNHKKKGFYVDIGANDPACINNTKLFYCKGWKGMNIEPNTGLFKKFLSKRGRDINLNIGIGHEKGLHDFYVFKNHVYSTFSKEEAGKRISKGFSVEIKKVEVDRLENILAKHLPKDHVIDFFSIDTEGYDMVVLKTNDWKKFRPKLICIEVADCNKKSISKDRGIINYLNSMGYKEIFFNGINSILIDTSKNHGISNYKN